jgi:acetylornithine deacetylase/succinyl-diaminopimelate desuccinylase-like protein
MGRRHQDRDPSQAHAKITCRLVAEQDPTTVKDAIARHLRQRLPSGYRLEIVDHGPGTPAFALDRGSLSISPRVRDLVSALPAIGA